jgi:hypothetical protein
MILSQTEVTTICSLEYFKYISNELSVKVQLIAMQ